MYDVRGYYLTVINDEITTRYKVKIRKRGTRQEGVQAWAEVKVQPYICKFIGHDKMNKDTSHWSSSEKIC